MIEDDYEGCISKKELRSSFMKYCKMHHIKGASDKGMKVVLEDMFGAIEGRKWDGNSQEYVWEGIKFKDKLKISQISEEIPKVIEKKISRVFPNTLTNLTNLTNQEDFTLEEIKKAGYTLEEWEELNKSTSNKQ